MLWKWLVIIEGVASFVRLVIRSLDWQREDREIQEELERLAGGRAMRGKGSTPEVEGFTPT